MFIQWIKYCSSKTGKVKSEKGFTLVELLVVLVVTGVLASTLVIPFASNVNQAARPGIYTTATQLASADLEYQKMLGFSAITVPNGAVAGSSTTVINGRSYTRTVTTSYADADFNAGGNSFVAPVTNDYIIVEATVTETTMNPNLSVSLKSIITPDYN